MPSKIFGPPTIDEKGNEVKSILHPKSYQDVGELTELFTPAPRNRYQPVAFGDIAMELMTQLSIEGLEVTKTTIETVPGSLGGNDIEYVLNYGQDHNYGREDMQMFCWFDIVYSPDEFKHTEMLTYRFGVLTSHDGTRGIWLVAGATVKACFNGCVWGNEYNAKLNHFGSFSNIHAEIQDMFREGIQIIGKKHKSMDKSITKMIEIPLNDEQAHDTMIKSARSGAVSPSKLLEIDNHWMMNNEAGEKFPDRNVWSLYNAFTESYKGNRVTSAFDNNRKLNRVFSSEYALQLAA